MESIGTLQVRLGQDDLSSDGSFSYGVQKIVLHPDFRMSRVGYPVTDVALLQLDQAIDSTKSPSSCTMCLPAAEQSFAGASCNIAGYGVASQSMSNISDFMLRYFALASHYEAIHDHTVSQIVISILNVGNLF